jgi:hypothetical protein
MGNELIKTLETLVKTLEAGTYAGTAPDRLTQGAALGVENLETVMQNVTFDDSHIKLQKLFSVKKAKSLLVQFNRQLSYGRFGGSAQREGAVGDVDVGDYLRATVPMCFYSTLKRVTVAADMVETFDGKKGTDREAENAAIKLAADVEFDSFKGKADFSNAGVFDGNPIAIAELPNILGLDPQVRMSDIMASTQDLMFAAYGSSQSVVLNQSGALDQNILEDAALRSRLNFGKAELMMVDPVILSGYNKRVLNYGNNTIQRIILAGSAQDASGADLRRQWVSSGTVSLEDSMFLRGKYTPNRPTIGAPVAPAASGARAGGSSALPALGTAVYLVSAENERGEGIAASASVSGILAGDEVTITITHPGGATHFNVYRGATAASAKFIGRVKNDGSGASFIDLGNKAPGFVTGYLIQKDTWGLHELAPYSRLKLAISDLSTPEAHFRFLTLCGYQPRKNVIVDNLTHDRF